VTENRTQNSAAFPHCFSAALTVRPHRCSENRAKSVVFKHRIRSICL